MRSIRPSSPPQGAALAELMSLVFCSAGPLAEVHFPIDSLTKKPKGFSFVTYMIPENAVTALAQLDGHVFQVVEIVCLFVYLLCLN